MTTLESDGFLSSEIRESRKRIVEVYKKAFMLGRRSNQEAMKVLRVTHVDWNEKSEPIISALFIRIVETYQGILLLLQMGMVAQARMLVRAGLEALFTMTAIVRDSDLLESYIAQHFDAVVKALKAASRWKQDDLRGQLSTEKIEELIAQNEAEVKSAKGKKLTVRQWAGNAELDNFYNVFYMENCSAVHSDMWALNDHINRKQADKLEICFGPNDVGLYHTLRTAATMLLSGVETIVNAKKLQPDRVKKLREQWRKLDEISYSDQ